MLKTHHFQHMENSVSENGNDVVVCEESDNSDSKNNWISSPVPSEEKSLFQPLFDKLIDT